MKRYYPFLLAIVATALAVGLSLALTRAHVFELREREINWRRLLGRVVDEPTEALEPEAVA